MLEPKGVKHRKMFALRIKKQYKETKVLYPVFGVYALVAVESGYLSARELEAGRRALRKRIKKAGKLWLQVYPSTSITSKPSEMRMGKGKGAHDRWVCVVRKGRILFEVSSSEILGEDLRKALKYAGERLGVKTKIVELKV